MLCRALIAAVAVTYLMCVFLLNGMQKEDLDGSMLTKLQRYNVNIDDMNNEELRQECIKSQYNNSNGEVLNVTQPQLVIKNENDFNPNTFIGSLKGSLNTENEKVYNNNVINQSSHLFIENKNKASTKYEDNRAYIADVTKYNEGPPNLENILKFWTDARLNQVVKINEPIRNLGSKKEQESKRSVNGNLRSSENDAISILLENFLKTGYVMTNKPTTTQRSVNVGNMYEKLYSLQTHDVGKMFDDVQSHQLMSLGTVKKESGMKKMELNQTNLDDFFRLLNTNNNYRPFFPDHKFDNNFNKNTKENFMLPQNPKLENFRRFENVETTTNIESKQTISQDVIKEIAESVKAIILRDLRKEIFQTTTLRTTATNTVSTIGIQNTEKIETTIAATIKGENIKAESMMNKFLELFEEIKSLKQNNMAITNVNAEGSGNKIIRQKYEIGELKVYPEVTTPSKTQPLYNVNQIYGFKQYPKANFENDFNFAPQRHKFRSNASLIKPDLNKGLLPITVQTNNIEIPPIGIPLNKPQNIINQNIIVTTVVPYRIGSSNKENQQRGIQHYDRTRTFETYKSKQLDPRLYKGPEVHQIQPLYSKYKDDVIRFTLNNNEHSKYNADYYEKINVGKYRSSSERAANVHNYQQLPRFHDKIENVGRFRVLPEQKKYVDEIDCCDENYAYSKAMVECCNRKIASRQQMSLNNMKRNSYDDTHFNNFLQSQQKVTDMLEKILAHKGNVQSVETA